MHANERDAPFHMGKTAASNYGFSVGKCCIFKWQADSYSHMTRRLCEFMCKKSNLAVWRRQEEWSCTHVQKWRDSVYRRWGSDCQQLEKDDDRLSDYREFGLFLLPGSDIVPHVYSSPPHSQSRGHCTADIPGPHPQASSSSSFLYGLKMRRKTGGGES